MKRIAALALFAVPLAAQAPATTPQSAAPAKPGAQAATYKKEIPATLAAKAKVTEAAAAATALAKVPGGKIASVELEQEDGKLIYSYDIKVSGKSGTEEVHVDAITGAVVGVEHEDAAAEKKEATEEKAAKKSEKKADAKAPATKKP